VEWSILLNILEIYERGYGQKIILNKTVVFFSSAVTHASQEDRRFWLCWVFLKLIGMILI
jgi:hypothetical protein